MTRALWVLLLVWIISVTFSLPWLYYNKVSIDVTIGQPLETNLQETLEFYSKFN